MISVIMPFKNEEKPIESKLAALHRLQPGAEIIVVISGNEDLITEYAVVCRTEGSGRGAAIDTGTKYAHGETLLFLHSDTDLPENAFHEIEMALKNSNVVGGWFQRRLDDPHFRFRFVDFGANAFSFLSGIATGDQAIFCRRSAWAEVGGCGAYPLFEDMHLCRRLKKLGKLITIDTPVLVSPRRFYRNGVTRTVLTNLWLTLKYFAGRDPCQLFDEYYGSE
jgi:rSAM/selenodomain-associated transferase 2